ncbi:MAG: iron ABC transporter permease [Bacteroidales bacterium]|nr:iron ABC transporter permease [Bacteroidales bacterium]
MIGSRRSRDEDEYYFVDGKAMRADEVVRIEVDTPSGDTTVPGMESEEVQDVTDSKKPRKRWSVRRAYKELDSSPAFEIDEDGLKALRGDETLYKSERSHTWRITIVMLAILLALVLASLCISYISVDVFYTPIDVFRAIGRRIYLFVGEIFHLSYYTVLSDNEAARELTGYSDILERCNVTFTTVVCGFLLSVAGMLYQNVFRNPIASPTMLGVSSGVRIGTIILVITFGVAALNYGALRYAYCYIGGIVILLGVLGFSKLLAGRGRQINVADMLIVGSIFSELLSVVSQYFLSYILSDEEWEVFYELTSGMRGGVSEWYSLLFLFVIIAVTIVPIFLMRFRINTVSFDDSEARLLGVNPQRLRVFVLVMGTLAILAAQIHVGVISMVSLVVPFLVRYVVGSEFRKQLIGNMILGPIMLLLCRDICSLIPFVGGGLSLEMVVGFVALPVYIWMMALGRRGWE